MLNSAKETINYRLLEAINNIRSNTDIYDNSIYSSITYVTYSEIVEGEIRVKEYLYDKV